MRMLELHNKQAAGGLRAGKLSKAARWLAGLQAFIGIGALAGGAALVTAPDGGNMGLSVDALRRGPLSDYLVPGLVLIAVVGGSMFVAAAALLRRSPWAVSLSLAAGAVLVVWIAVQVAIMGLVSWLQPLYLLLGLTVIAIAVLLRSSWRSQV